MPWSYTVSEPSRWAANPEGVLAMFVAAIVALAVPVLFACLREDNRRLNDLEREVRRLQNPPAEVATDAGIPKP